MEKVLKANVRELFLLRVKLYFMKQSADIYTSRLVFAFRLYVVVVISGYSTLLSNHLDEAYLCIKNKVY